MATSSAVHDHQLSCSRPPSQLFKTTSSAVHDHQLSSSWPQAQLFMTTSSAVHDHQLSCSWPQAQLFMTTSSDEMLTSHTHHTAVKMASDAAAVWVCRDYQGSHLQCWLHLQAGKGVWEGMTRQDYNSLPLLESRSAWFKGTNFDIYSIWPWNWS
jgi:hypothetical protein